MYVNMVDLEISYISRMHVCMKLGKGIDIDRIL